MREGMRRGLLGVALFATLAAVFVVHRNEERIQNTEPLRAERPQPSAGASAIRVRFATGGGDLFPAHSWRPPPPMDATPAAPVAPPLPYEFKGRLEEGGHTRVFLARQQSMLVVKEGDTLEGLYHVEAITPWSMELTYLPLKQKQSLSFSR